MADTNIPVIEGNENNLDTQNPLIAKVGAALEVAKCHTQACVLALTVAMGGAAHADEPVVPENIILASAENGVSDDTQGGVIDSSLNAAQIQNQITLTQTQITELEAKDALTGQDRREVYLLKKQLIELERSQTVLEEQETASNTATIDAERLVTKTQEGILDDLEEINSAVGG